MSVAVDRFFVKFQIEPGQTKKNRNCVLQETYVTQKTIEILSLLLPK